MERYCAQFSPDVNEWENIIKKVDELPFECIHLLGHGEHCSVYTITPVSGEGEHDESEGEVEFDDEGEEERHWTEDYFQMDDVEGAVSDTD